jgi:hypothetical protein
MTVSQRLQEWEFRYDVAFVFQDDTVYCLGWPRLPPEVKDVCERFEPRLRRWLKDKKDLPLPAPLFEEIAPGEFRCSIPRQYRGPALAARIEALVARRVEENYTPPTPQTRFDEEVLGQFKKE